MLDSPAKMLQGHTLDGGWVVDTMIPPKEGGTGGHFSIGYRVKNAKGDVAFMKALNFSAAFQAQDQLSAFKKLVDDADFERSLLEICEKKRLTRVLTPIASGKTTVNGFGPFGVVMYIIFEMADGSMRDYMVDNFAALDLAWQLSTLHHVAIGLKQLHSVNISHQDIKPSNVLYRADNGSKIADLGRSITNEIHCPHGNLVIAGDLSYAPIDLCYPSENSQDLERRFITDLYLLGSLIFCHFLGISATHAIRLELKSTILERHSFRKDLPYIQEAFATAIERLRTTLEPIAGPLTAELVQIAHELCEPDPERRGDPQWFNSVTPNYDLSSYISKFDRLSKQAMRLKK